MTSKLAIIAVIIGVAAIISYLATTFLINTNTASNLQQQEEEESPTIRDSERVQIIGKCHDNPDEECDKQMVAIYAICQSETEEAANISCRDERLKQYVEKYLDRQP